MPLKVSIFRFFRFIRSISTQLITILGFSVLLTWIFILYQPTHGPGQQLRIGWQAWDVVSTDADQYPVDDNTTADPNDEDIEWWDKADVSNQPDSSNLPLDVWSPILPHNTGLTELTILKCILPPYMVELCAPKTTPEQDALKGPWVRVDNDLNLQTGYWSLYMYYRRSRRLDVNIISDIRILPENEELPSEEGWNKVSTSMRDGVPRAPPLFLWYQLGKTAGELSQEEKQNLITELDIHRGSDRVWYGFEKIDPPTTEEIENRVEPAWVTYRKGVKIPPRAQPLHFTHNGTFKILQIADLHYSVGKGHCRDVDFPCDSSDNLTNTLLGHVLDEEQPSMVVFSGDQLNGQGTSWDSRSVLAKFAIAVTDRKIPWAAVFGNHDSENGLTREDQMKFMQALPYNLVQPGPKDIHGVGNYALQVRSADKSMTPLLTIYCLDSGDYYNGLFDFFGFIIPSGYDYVRKNQIEWFLNESASIPPIERPFSPTDLWDRQAQQVPPQTKRLAKPNAMMFFHIPMQEAFGEADVDTRNGQPLDYGLHGLEKPGNSDKNDGFFEDGILKALESDHAAGSHVPEVKVISNGHDHITENCRRTKGVWQCFGGGGSYAGYGKVGFDRRFRIYEISDFGETIRTYKRTEKDDILDQLELVGKGAPPRYEGIA